MPVGTQLAECQLFWLLRQDWWGWGPQASQSLERKRRTRSISYYFLSNCFRNTFFKPKLSYHVNFPALVVALFASQEKPVRKARNCTEQGGGWCMKGSGKPGKGERELAARNPSWGHSLSQQCHCRVPCQPNTLYHPSEWCLVTWQCPHHDGNFQKRYIIIKCK